MERVNFGLNYASVRPTDSQKTLRPRCHRQQPTARVVISGVLAVADREVIVPALEQTLHPGKEANRHALSQYAQTTPGRARTPLLRSCQGARLRLR